MTELGKFMLLTLTSCTFANEWLDNSRILPIATFRAELDEIEGDIEFHALLKATRNYAQSDGTYQVNVVNLIRAIRESNDKRFVKFVKAQADDGAEYVRPFADISMRWMEAATLSSEHRFEKFKVLLRSPMVITAKMEIAWLLARNNEREAREYFRYEYRKTKDRGMRKKIEDKWVYIGVLLSGLPESCDLIEKAITGLSPFSGEYMQMVLGIDFRKVYWEVKTQGLSQKKKLDLLLDALKDGAKSEVKPASLAQGAYLHLRSMGKAIEKFLIDTVIDLDQALLVRLRCVDLIFNINDGDTLLKLAAYFDANDGDPQLKSHFKGRFAEANFQSMKRDVNPFGSGFLKAPKFAPKTE